MILLVQVMYYIIILGIILAGAFIVYHIVAYSFSAYSKVVTLLIFFPVFAVLILTNIMLFSNIDFQEVFSGLML